MNDVKSIHGSCVAIGQYAALLRGESGSGKSDLTLRFLNLTKPNGEAPDYSLVADDRVIISNQNGKLIARSPDTIRGKIEIRGVGLISFKSIAQAELRIIVDLVPGEQVPRMQYPFDETSYIDLEGVMTPCIKMYPFETSAAIKLKYWLDIVTSQD